MPSDIWSAVRDGHSARVVRLKERLVRPPLMGTTIWIGPDGALAEPLLKILAKMSSVVPEGAPTKDSPDTIPISAAALHGVDGGQIEFGIALVETEELPLTSRLITAVPLDTLLVKL